MSAFLWFTPTKDTMISPTCQQRRNSVFPMPYLPSFWGIYARKDVPEPIKRVLSDVCKKIFDDPDFRKGIQKLGGQPRYGGPDFIRAAIKKTDEIGIPILKELGLYVGK